MEWLDTLKENVQHPFFMLIGGQIFWFLLLWSIARNKNPDNRFWSQQIDEMVVTFVGGLLFWFFTPYIMGVWDWAMSNETPTEFQCFFYLIVAPAIERIYKLKTR